MTKKPGWSHVGGSTMPDTPIETLSKVLDTQLDCESTMYADARKALEDVEALVAALLQRCPEHQLPIEFEPQGDAQYPLTGWWHPIAGKPNKHNRSGIVYARCGLTDDERTALAKFTVKS